MSNYQIPDAPQRLNHGSSSSGLGCGCLGFLGSIMVFIAICLLALAVFSLSETLRNILPDELKPAAKLNPISTNVTPTIVKLEIKGGIFFQEEKKSFFKSKSETADDIIEVIKDATEDKEVKGLYLLIDSPGGEITACDLIYRELRKFRNSDTNRVIVAFLRSTAASGGYYVALPANKIIATPTTITGSIGVLMNGLNFRKAAEKLGVESMTFTSGPMKDMLNPFNSVSPEVSNVVHSVIGELYDQFVKVVVESRGLSDAEVRKLADGRIYTARQALDAKLIDVIGYEEDVKSVFKELGLPEYELKEYDEDDHFWDKFLRSISTVAPIRPFVSLPKSGFSFRYEAPLSQTE